MKQKYSLVIPLFNEQDNIVNLVEKIVSLKLIDCGLDELVLVDNGSFDKTSKVIKDLQSKYSWIRAIYLKVNQNYGGGILHGINNSKNDITAIIPGDLQICPSELKKLFQLYITKKTKTNCLLIKGKRDSRDDSFYMRVVSYIYNKLASFIFDIKPLDINGLPKIFDKKLTNLLRTDINKSFLFDLELILTCIDNNYQIVESSVNLADRGSGKSSWSGKRINTYSQIFLEMIRLKKIRSKKHV